MHEDANLVYQYTFLVKLRNIVAEIIFEQLHTQHKGVLHCPLKHLLTYNVVHVQLSFDKS